MGAFMSFLESIRWWHFAICSGWRGAGLRTAEGWLYLAGGAGSLQSAGDRLVDEGQPGNRELPLAALDMALQARNHPAAVIHHSDRGCQYASQAEVRQTIFEYIEAYKSPVEFENQTS